MRYKIENVITAGGRELKQFSLRSTSGMEMEVLNLGGIITCLKVPNGDSTKVDVVLGYDDLDEYFVNPYYLGAIIGRFSNRIANGKFTIDEELYQLVTNLGSHHIHGGNRGFGKVFWDGNVYEETDRVILELKYLSQDGEEGYPGQLSVTVQYILEGNSLTINYHATTDKKTPISLTQHSYFNLRDHSNTILDHELHVRSNQILEVDDELIPTGGYQSVEGSIFDFTEPKSLREMIRRNYEKLEKTGGYDHYYILQNGVPELKSAVTLSNRKSGISMHISTSEPGIQLYTGNHLEGIRGKNGIIYKNHGGLCLETQHFPDSPNRPEFPSSILEVGSVYRSSTKFEFNIL